MTGASLAADAETAIARAVAGRRRRVVAVSLALVLLLAGLAVLSMGRGALAVPPQRVVEILSSGLHGKMQDMGGDSVVVLDIRLPRTLMAMAIGAALAVSGALMQGLFRNPLADPALLGVSGGAGLAVGCAIVLADRPPLSLLGRSSFVLLPPFAFCGALISMVVLYLIATRRGRTSMATMLLAGVALAALAASLTGLLAFLSDDRQLRDLTFWTLGSLSGAGWSKLVVTGPLILAMLIAALPLGRGLNALAFGEAAAFHLGIPVQLVKTAAITVVSISVGASVAAAGMITFVGIIAPHLLRLLVGPDHRVLLPLSALGGAALVVAADIVARTIVVPAELPIGIVTAGIGAPFFLWLLLRRGQDLEA